VSWRKGGRARLRVVSEGGQEARWEMAELAEPPLTVGRIDLPFPMAPERLDYRQDVATRIRRSPAARGTRRQRRARRRDDPAKALTRITHDITMLEARLADSRSSISRQFDAVCQVLRECGYLNEWEVTPEGRMLASIYHERDLLLAQALRAELFDGLTEPELASLLSTLIYEHRSPGPPPDPWFPTPELRQRFELLCGLWETVARHERGAGITDTTRPDAGFAGLAYGWASGQSLATMLDGTTEFTAGDFVRNVKQIVDLVSQIAVVAPNPTTQAVARRTAGALHRGVVALSGSVEST